MSEDRVVELRHPGSFSEDPLAGDNYFLLPH